MKRPAIPADLQGSSVDFFEFDYGFKKKDRWHEKSIK